IAYIATRHHLQTASSSICYPIRAADRVVRAERTLERHVANANNEFKLCAGIELFDNPEVSNFDYAFCWKGEFAKSAVLIGGEGQGCYVHQEDGRCGIQLDRHVYKL
ncbi:hypothetical protein HK097_001464, partial [Rhizophlyctis rosea]